MKAPRDGGAFWGLFFSVALGTYVAARIVISFLP